MKGVVSSLLFRPLVVRLRAAEKGGHRGSHISRAAPHGTCRSPALAAYIVLRTTGGSVRLWVRQVLAWRVQPRWYLYALGLPVLLFAVVNLPRLQQRFTPLRATLLLAVLWGLWHLPIYGIAFVGPMLFAVFYPYLYNRTGSVGLCMLLHGSFTAALDNLTLTPWPGWKCCWPSSPSCSTCSC
jgi:membrane protease YdiL (CAAX protease family)